jgi:SAM-dependent methyltransferase
MERFRRSEPLPEGYGAGLDERCVEYPWALSRLRRGDVRMLDAGSVLNTDYILDRPVVARATKHILTLAPEGTAFWQRGISYLYEDLRDIPTRDEFYDCIVCLSTLEHVGMDNHDYTGSPAVAEERPEDFKLVMRELYRVLRPGGMVLLSVPYGRYERRGVMQQFDRQLLAEAIEAFPGSESIEITFFRYHDGAWAPSAQEDCDDAQFGVWGTSEAGKVTAAVPAAEAVACVRLTR